MWYSGCSPVWSAQSRFRPIHAVIRNRDLESFMGKLGSFGGLLVKIVAGNWVALRLHDFDVVHGNILCLRSFVSLSNCSLERHLYIAMG